MFQQDLLRNKNNIGQISLLTENHSITSLLKKKKKKKIESKADGWLQFLVATYGLQKIKTESQASISSMK